MNLECGLGGDNGNMNAMTERGCRVRRLDLKHGVDVGEHNSKLVDTWGKMDELWTGASLVCIYINTPNFLLRFENHSLLGMEKAFRHP